VLSGDSFLSDHFFREVGVGDRCTHFGNVPDAHHLPSCFLKMFEPLISGLEILRPPKGLSWGTANFGQFFYVRLLVAVGCCGYLK